MPAIPMFPLGTVLLPAMPLQLQVFEPRYLQMLMDLLEAARVGESDQIDGDLEFGVVLIERGHEVGGGDRRFDTGTLARIDDLDVTSGLVRLTAHGSRRFDVDAWLPDEPFPRAEVTERPELIWERRLESRREEAEALVRRTLALGSEFREGLWAADLELSPDPVAAVWQLAGITPIGDLDRIRLLRSESMEDLIATTIEVTTDAAVVLQAE